MRNNYVEILSHKVEIPIIQRDYAQGRTDNKTNKIRKDFLDVLFDFILHKHTQDSNAEIELDFIYGFNEQDITTYQTTFVPIDGQQRLTTLWLLYWFVSVKENIPDSEKVFLSNFLYETRHSTTEFCKRLIQFKPVFSSDFISEEIKNQAWYFETWDYDPSIQAMLIVLNDIEERYDKLNIVAVWSVIEGAECPFHFYKLDMNKVGLTDDLYIKMNSRGKALTEFEYFKAGFSELITQPKQKKRFEKSIDGVWIEAVWNIVFESGGITNEDDIALIVDNSFLNLFNFITSVISFKKDIKTKSGFRYRDTVVSVDLLKIIYSDTENQNFLLDTLDAICIQQENVPLFWSDTFYFGKDEFEPTKTRLFFQHKEVNLLKLCLFPFSENRGLSFPEQLLLLACFTQLKTPNNDFQKRIRTIRNLVINSENELRETILGYSFDEIEDYIVNGDLDIFKNFKTDQIEEEKKKEQFLTQSVSDTEILRQLEDSDILRGSISLLPLDPDFGKRAEKFLELFEEDEMITDFDAKCNLLLCFGDYSQDDGLLTNLMSPSRTIIRSFFTTPGYNKAQFYSKTQTVVLSCLGYFITNPTISTTRKIKDALTDYSSNPKDWRYYFMKYASFRGNCTRGYYNWHNGDYCIWKMRVKQFNGYHWDPFLLTISEKLKPMISLENYGAPLMLIKGNASLKITNTNKGFQLEITEDECKKLFETLRQKKYVDVNNIIQISQNKEGVDIEDRIEKGVEIISEIIKIS